VHLTTTDPAAHLDQVLAGEVVGLDVSRIDPVEATSAYRERVMRTKEELSPHGPVSCSPSASVADVWTVSVE